MSRPRIYVTHHVRESFREINDFAVAMLWHLEALTPEPHETVLALWHPPGEEHLRTWLEERLPPGVEVLFNDRPGRPDVQPSLRNLCVLDARRRGADQLMVLLHADVRVSISWLGSLLAELEREKAPAILHPRYAPYCFLSPQEGAPSREYPIFWEQIRDRKRCLNGTEFGEWIALHRLPSRDSEIVSTRIGCVDGAGGLMMFICRAGIFDCFGLCDESFTGVNYDDDDWALRAIASGVRNLQCNGVWIGHLVGMTFSKSLGMPGIEGVPYVVNNGVLFAEKWANMIAEVGGKNGALWDHLRYGQPKAAPPSGPFYELEKLC